MRLIGIAFFVLAAAMLGAARGETRVLIMVGPSNHAPGTHEVEAGGRLMQWALENLSNVPGIKADVVHEWPKERRVLDAASAIVFIGDIFPPQRLPDRDAVLKDLTELTKRGCGIVGVHYATGLRAEDVAPDGAHPLLDWMGGYFATRGAHHQSVAKVFQSVKISPAATAHPVLRGWREFTLDDEPYYNNYFGGDGNRPAPNVTAFATAMLPPEAPKREVVAWGTERKDGGRGFAIVMPHFYKNWANEDLRRFILNGIVWTAKLNIPAEGVRSPAPDLAKFAPESVEPRPRPAARAAAIENDQVRVLDVTSPPHRKSALHEHAQNRVMIYLTAGTNRLEYEGGRVENLTFQPGDALWSPAGGRHTSDNPGGQPFRVVEVELKNGGAPFEPGPFDPVRVAPQWYRVTLDNPQVRVLRVAIPGNAKVPLHEHARNRVVVYLSDAWVRVTRETGETSESRVAAGEVRWAGTAKHAEENLAAIPLDVVVVELK
jgi:uncharacterized RmlC-like cupin family protein/type 1 glutamine amidotransferase